MRRLPLDTSLKEIEVYVLVSQISKEVFVWKIGKGGSYQAYKRHVGSGFKLTKDLFQRSEQKMKFPQMFLLESIVAAEEDAFRFCIAWMKYFLEHEFTLLANDTNLRYVDDLLPATEEIYEAIRDLPIEEVLAPEKLIVENYKKRESSAKRTPKDEIKISVSHKEYKRILEAAEENKLSMSRYCKNMILDGQIVKVDSPPLFEYFAEVRGAKIILRQILYAIYKNGKYYPADLENIQRMVDSINEQTEAMQKEYREFSKVLMKVLPK